MIPFQLQQPRPCRLPRETQIPTSDQSPSIGNLSRQPAKRSRQTPSKGNSSLGRHTAGNVCLGPRRLGVDRFRGTRGFVYNLKLPVLPLTNMARIFKFYRAKNGIKLLAGYYIPYLFRVKGS